MGLDTLSGFSIRGNNFSDFLFALLNANPLLKRVYSKRKKITPHLDVHPTGDQEVADLIPAGSGNILSWQLVM